MTGSPVVAVNRAIAIAELHGVGAGLEALDAVADDPRLETYQPFWAARAELLARAGHVSAAREAYERAIGLESDPAIRRFLVRRRAELMDRGGPVEAAEELAVRAVE
jgi:RNA polymerase sigma-70 factor (ECF subfamily)